MKPVPAGALCLTMDPRRLFMKLPWVIVAITCIALSAAEPPVEREPAGPVFEDVLPTLDKTVDLIDKHEGLPRRTLLFGEDQRSNRRRIDELLAEAVEALGVSGLSE